MARSIRLALTLALLAGLVVGAGAADAANGDHAKKLITTHLVGVDPAGTVVVGVPGAGLPWVLDKGKAKLFADGRIELDIQGLVFAAGPNIGRNTVTSGRVSVVCNGNANPATDRVTTADPVPFSVPDGDVHFDGQLAIPSPCENPVVFFTSNAGSWFAFGD
jgi:hypothetical protein